jgi:hypothetical protein
MESPDVRAIALTNDGSSIVAVGEGFTARLDVGTRTGLPAAIEATAGMKVATRMLPGDKEFTTLGADGALEVRRLADLSLLGSTDAPSATRVHAHSSGQALVTTGDDGMMRMFACQ